MPAVWAPAARGRCGFREQSHLPCLKLRPGPRGSPWPGVDAGARCWCRRLRLGPEHHPERRLIREGPGEGGPAVVTQP